MRLPFDFLDKRPIIIALAGSNGSGKATFDESYRSEEGLRFINADELSLSVDCLAEHAPLETPHLDRLTSQSMRLTNAYTAAPVCSPTRAAMLTSKSPTRLQIINPIPAQPHFATDNVKLLSAPMRDHLPFDEVTLSERLWGASYATGFFGKRHLAGRGRSQRSVQAD